MTDPAAADAPLATIEGLTVYPVKSLSPQPLDSVLLEPDRCLPHDREFAIAHGATGFDFAHPAWVKKTNFAVLVRHDRLAALDSRFDPETGVLQLLRRDRVVASGNLHDEAGRKLIEQFLNAFLDDKVPKPVRMVAVPDQPLTDQRAPLISVINRDSLRDLERIAGQPIDPRRFRGNILVGTGKPWSERGWVGRRIRLGATAVAEVVENIERCAAININPETRDRDLNLPAAMIRNFQHMDCGVFIRILEPGMITARDRISLMD